MANFLPYTKLKAEDLNAAFAEKADAAALAQKADTTTVNAALAQKADLVGGKVPTNQLPDAVLGALSYQEAWDAATNTPSIPSAGDANKGHYYVVQVAGTTAIDGESDWQIGDWIVSNGAYWEKVDNSDKVSSVNGKAGPVVLTASDVGAEPADSSIVKAAATQTLTNKTLSGVVLNDGYTEKVFALSGTSPALNPANGTIQTWTLTGNSTPTESIAAGQSIVLMLTGASTYTVTWPSVTWKTNEGAPPELVPGVVTPIVLWKIGATLYGARVGDA